MKNKFINLKVIIISFIILILTITFFIVKKDNFSEMENRYLKKFPDFSFTNLKEGKYTNDIKEYLADHFPFRNIFMNFRTNILKGIGFTNINGVYFGSNDYLILEYPKFTNRDLIIKILNEFYQNNKEIKIDLMLVPTSISINYNKLPKYVNNSQIDDINYIYSKLNFNGIILDREFFNSNEELFYRLDHHWNSNGAYLAYTIFCKSNDIKYNLKSEYKYKELSNDFRGTLYSKVIDNSLKSDTLFDYQMNYNISVNYVISGKRTDTLYSKDCLSKKDKYAYFFDGNHPLIEITNLDSKTNNEILVIKDSYANSFIPYLVDHYKVVRVIDPRFYKLSISDYIDLNPNISNILFLYNINSINNDTGIYFVK